ncbi:hypothetical protein OE88DRAFT_1665720 [Heliocybe sulcata]|uniref:Wings apart-like protein C-terminal domain-containing protein n=1 Tax=Heliocybe sulcata TaxID=5364 RepID=A0A5C3N1E2_9AGAM|nr:hypothetical protein OE88DRAFT_1665720 [Heliocybe sulcata]
MSAKITYSRRLSQRKDEARTRKRRRLEEEDTDVDDPTSPKPVVTYLSRTPSSSGRTKSFQDLARSSTPPQLDSSRPSSPAKDISALFASTFSSSSSSSPSPKRGVAKRMLSRSRTEPTIPSPTRTPRASGSMGSVLSQSPSRSPQQSLSPSKPPTTDYLSARPPKRTYAGKSRSFLVALPVSALPEVQDDDELRESYTDLRARWGIEDSDDIELTMPGASSKGKEKSSAPVPTSGLYNDLKSITDLRSRGESRRFLDELGYLFEGLEGGEGVKRGSLLDLTTRLCQPSFSRRARAADLGPRVWDLVGRDRDLILTPTLALFTTITVRDSPALEEFDPPARAETVSFLFSLLSPSPSLSSSSARSETRKAEGKDEAHGGQVDPLWMVGCAKSDAEMRRAGLGRGEVAMVKRLHALIQDKSGLIGEGTIISTRLLASLALTSLSPALIPSTRANLSALRSVVSTDVSGLQRRVDAYISGASFRGEEEAGEVEWGYIAHLLVLLDSYFLGRWGSPAGDEDEDGDGRWEDEMKEELVNELVMVLVSVGVARREGEGAANAGAFSYEFIARFPSPLFRPSHDYLPFGTSLTLRN